MSNTTKRGRILSQAVSPYPLKLQQEILQEPPAEEE